VSNDEYVKLSVRVRIDAAMDVLRHAIALAPCDVASRICTATASLAEVRDDLKAQETESPEAGKSR
jgi:hypothetical protein